MNVITMPSLRQRLRSETESDHKLVDSILSRLDITCRPDFIQFLLIHLDVYTRIRATGPAKIALDDICERLAADLSTLGFSNNPETNSETQEFHDLALEYIVHGSRLGAGVLRKKWLQSEDQDVRAAAAYFTASSASADWADLCVKLRRMPWGGAISDRVVADARQIFNRFAASALQHAAAT